MNTHYLIVAIVVCILVALYIYWYQYYLHNGREGQKKYFNKSKVTTFKYTDERGIININRNTLLNSDYFKQILHKTNTKEPDVNIKLMKQFMRPYSHKELFNAVQAIRAVDSESKDKVENAYKLFTTASSIVFNKTIPSVMFANSQAVIRYCAIYINLVKPVSYSDELKKYTFTQYHKEDAVDVPRYHKELKLIIEDLPYANEFLSNIFDYEYYFTVEYLYSFLFSNKSTGLINIDFYKQDIENFKKLLTVYFGIYQVNPPIDYLHFNSAIVEYVIQTKRYSKFKIKLMDIT